MRRRLWTKGELKQALKLYCITPFGKIHARNPSIIQLASHIDRTANAVALKLVNFASLDQTIEQKGMGHVGDLDKQVWREFFDELKNPALDPAEQNNGFAEQPDSEFMLEGIHGYDVDVMSTRRINQQFFRKLVLASYNSKCALSGITAPELLVAGHIVPWSRNPSLRTDPRNGICLNSLFDKAFDRGLITFDEQLRLVFSSKLPWETVGKMKGMASEQLILPSRFRPNAEYFEYHRESVFQ